LGGDKTEAKNKTRNSKTAKNCQYIQNNEIGNSNCKQVQSKNIQEFNLFFKNFNSAEYFLLIISSAD